MASLALYLKSMIRFVKLLVILICLIVFLWFPKGVLAEGEFANSYDVTYDVDPSGITTVAEDVTLKNLTDRYFASSFTLTIGSTQVFDVSASDKSGAIETSVKTDPTSTKIAVNFKEQVVGLGKQYKWSLKFKSKDFAQAQGKVWQVSVPRAPKLTDKEDYKLTLAIPVSFGDPTTITPSPVSQNEAGGKILFHYTKNQILQNGILANFGDEQLLDFKINYSLNNNNNVLPAIARVSIPPDTNLQDILINKISPEPENVTVDEDGNYLAWFKVGRGENVQVIVEGLANLHIKPTDSQKGALSKEQLGKLSSSQQYWEADNPSMKAKSTEIFKGQDLSRLSNSQKAALIDRFVVSYLTYDDKRVSDGDFTRLGALTALNNPTQALCGEYTDLFIALARSAGVPARRLEGYAYTSNRQIRPLSLGQTLLHAWPEYYDETKGWVMIDPTWENTNSGVDYFSKFDLNHLVISILGGSSTDPSVAGEVEVKFSDAKFSPNRSLALSLGSPDQFLSGFPVDVAGEVQNKGNVFLPASKVEVATSRLMVANNQNQIATPILPPYGKVNFKVGLNPANVLVGFNDTVSVSIMGQQATKQLILKPFYRYPLFLVSFIVIGLMTIFLYLLSLAVHIKTPVQTVKLAKSKKGEKG